MRNFSCVGFNLGFPDELRMVLSIYPVLKESMFSAFVLNMKEFGGFKKKRIYRLLRSLTKVKVHIHLDPRVYCSVYKRKKRDQRRNNQRLYEGDVLLEVVEVPLYLESRILEFPSSSKGDRRRYKQGKGF